MKGFSCRPRNLSSIAKAGFSMGRFKRLREDWIGFVESYFARINVCRQFIRGYSKVTSALSLMSLKKPQKISLFHR